MFKKLTSLLILLLAVGSASAALPAGWTGMDIANPAFTTPGTSAEVGGVWTLTASGNDIWNNDDEFHYCFTTMRGDAQLTARVVNITGGTNVWRKAGVMIRNELLDTSVHVHLLGRPDTNGGGFQWRPVAGAGSSSSNYGDPDIPIYLKIVREDNVFSGYTSPDGVTWTQRGSVEIDMASNVYAGLSLTSHDVAEIATATYDNVQFLNPGLNQALEPSPANGAMVSPWVDAAGVYVMLDYSPGPDAVSYIGYFSDNFDDVNDRAAGASLGSPPWPGFSETAFYVGYNDAAIPAHARTPLVRGKTYYWAVDIWTGSETVKGKVWSFTVKLLQAYNPSPPDGVGFVPIDPNVDVSWEMGDVDTDGNSVRYEVFYGTDAGAVAAATVPDRTVLTTSANIGPLTRATGYAWRVDTVLTQTAPPFTVKRVTGDVWEFETMPAITNTDPNLEGWWKFDVGYGTTAYDWSGNDRNGTLIGASPQWVPGVFGNAIEFDGTDNQYVNIDGYQGILGGQPFSIATWVKSTAYDDRTIMSWGTGTNRERIDFRLFEGRLRVEHGAGNLQGDTNLDDGEWHHAALTVGSGMALRPTPGNTHFYLDGQLDATRGGDDDTFTLVSQHDLGIGIRVHNDQREFIGALDDVRLYDKELTAGEIAHLFEPAKAYNLSPADGEIDVPIDAKLTWSAGTDPATEAEFTTHHVYISTNFDDVNDETIAPIIVTGLPLEYAPAFAYYGIYHWKVNEVGSVTVKGDVQSFKAIYNAANIVDPELKLWFKFEDNVLDSSGYGRDGTAVGDPYYVAGMDGQAIRLDGDDDYVDVEYGIGISGGDPRTITGWAKATTTAIPNWTNLFGFTGPSGGGGHFDVEIVGGTDTTTAGWFGLHMYNDEYDIMPADIEWHHLAATFDGANVALYADGALVNSVVPTVTVSTPDNVHVGKRDDNTNNFPGSIDDVRIYDVVKSDAQIAEIMRIDLSLPWNPDPRHGAINVPPDQDLSWNHGDGATMSTVYFGADDPGNMTQVAGPQASTTYDPGLLNLGTTYFWQIAENNGSTGRVWKFTTTEYLTVDDMEAYKPWTDPFGPWIFVSWKDGFGDCTPGNGNDTGAVLTEDATVLLTGLQSMKYDFDNDGLVYSPCTLGQVGGHELYSRIEAQVAGLPSGIGSDWTVGGVKALVINFMGQVGNATTEPFWVQLQDGTKGYGTKVFYGDYTGEDMADFNEATWHEWNIDLADFDVDLTNVVSITIGVGDEDATLPGGSGTIYIDDIRLYVPRCVPARSSEAFAKVDLNSDCGIDYRDLDVMVGDWLDTDLLETGELLVRYEFNDAAGTTASDSSGKGRNGDVNDASGPSWVNDPTRGWCLDFNDGDFVLDDDADAYMNGLRGLTVALWVKNRETSPTDKGFIIFADPAGNDNRGFRYDAAGASSGGASVIKCGTFSTGASGGIQEYESAPNTQTTAWQHLAMTWSSGNDVRLFIDGVEDTTGAIQATRIGTTTGYELLYVGRGGKFNDASGGGWNGLIDDVQIYNYALTPAEILTVKGGGAIPPKSLYYPLASPAELYDGEDEGFRAINFKDYAELLKVWLGKELWPN